MMRSTGIFKESIRQPNPRTRIDEQQDRDSDHGRYYKALLKELCQGTFPPPLSFAWLLVTTVNAGFLPQIDFIQCLDPHRNHGVPMWTTEISYKELSDLVRYWMLRIYAFAIIIGVKPYLTKGKQWTPLVQWSYKEIKSEARKGWNATCDNVQNVEQRADVVSKMMHSPHLQRGQKIVPSTTFPSLECAKAHSRPARQCITYTRRACKLSKKLV